MGGDFSNWNDSYLLALGNELTGDRPWLGEFQLVAIFDQALNQSEVEQTFTADLILSYPYTKIADQTEEFKKIITNQ